LSTSSFIEFA